MGKKGKSEKERDSFYSEVCKLVAEKSDLGGIIKGLRKELPRWFEGWGIALAVEDKLGGRDCSVYFLKGKKGGGRLRSPAALPLGVFEKPDLLKGRKLEGGGGLEIEGTVPLRVNGSLVGAFIYRSNRKEKAEKLKWLRRTAPVLSNAIFRERLRAGLAKKSRQNQRKVEQLRVINEIATALVSTLILGEVLRILAGKASKVLGFDFIEVGLLSSDLSMIRFISAGRDGKVTKGKRHVSVEGTVAEEVFKRNRPLLFKDLEKVKEPGPIQRRLLRKKIRSLVLLPLTDGKRAIGTIGFFSSEKETYGRGDVDFLKQISLHVAQALRNARLYEESEERMKHMSALYEVGKSFLATTGTDEFLNEVLRIVGGTFTFDHCAVLLLDRERGELSVEAVRGYHPSVKVGWKSPVTEGVTGWVATTGKFLYVPDVRKEPRYRRGVKKGRSELALPLKVGGEVLGVLDVESTEVDAFSESDIGLLKLFSTQVAIAMDRADLFEKLKEQALTDGLTGLYNQRTFHHLLQKEIEKAKRREEPLTLILIDMDGLKRINDRFGHVTGNEAICHMASLIKENTRESDYVSRYGGDEFAIILPGCGLEAGRVMGEKLAGKFRTRKLRKVGSVTGSLGLVSIVPGDISASELVSLADRAMYAAKSRGKGKIFCRSYGKKEGEK